MRHGRELGGNGDPRRLRAVLKFQTLALAQDPTTGRVTEGTPTEKISVRGNITPLDGRELFAAQQVRPDTTHVVEMRYLDGLTADMQFVSDGKTYRLLEAPRNLDRRKQTMTFQVKEEA